MTTKPYIGGQAVLEGVMMRSPSGMAVAVRRPDGQIAVRTEALLPDERSFRKLPLVRGISALVASTGLGYRALEFSASQQDIEEETSASLRQNVLGALPLLLDLEESPVENSKNNWAMIGSLVFAIGLFVALPQGLASLTSSLLGWQLTVQDSRFHFLAGFFKLAILMSYLLLIRRVPEIRRVFQYHGAEHKTISAYEADLPLTVENVQKQTTLHPRCGTTFLIVVLITSVILGSILTPILLPNAQGLEGQIQTLALRISLLPLIAGISYEFQRFSAKYCTTGPLRVLLWPGFWFQKISTAEPDDSQAEVAITSFLASEKIKQDDAGKDAKISIFESFDNFRSQTA